MSKINVLDKSVYNQISAGEVVENPASVVKELVENSIDSGADSITVTIENGGIKSIIVTDNGCGMEKDDLKLAVMPHATSKIATAADLNTISTLGFRGEALASIAAVSELTIKSHYFESEEACYIFVKGGEFIEEGSCGLNNGTVISVKNLFFNVPVRYKFLKSEKGEENNVTKVIAEMIFSNPDISIKYVADGKTIYQTNGGGLEEAIYAVYGDEIIDSMININFSGSKGYSVNGYISRPASDAIKGNRSRQHIIVNGRIIEDSTLSVVIQNAYGESLMKRTFPTFILELIVPFADVDINVHPNKREVRFADRKTVNGIVYRAVKEGIEKDAEEAQKALADAFVSRQIGFTKPKPVVTEYKENPDEDFCEDITDSTENENADKNDQSEENRKIAPRRENSTSSGKDYSEKPENGSYFAFADSEEELKSVPVAEENAEITYKIIGQLFDTYLLLEVNENLILMDQHAAHERILYDRLISECRNGLAVQDFLLPYEYPIEPEQGVYLSENEENFRHLGFNIEIGENKLIVKSVPLILSSIKIDDFVAEILDENKKFTDLGSSDVARDKIAKMACRKAIKAGDSLSEAQIKYVLEYLFANGIPLQCPHGRPTMIKITKDEIEKRFGRRL